MCKFFPASLEGEAKNWFYTFPDESIGNYGVLVETFLKTYMHNNISRPRVNKLFTLARRFREPLRSLTDRLRKLYTDIGKVPVDQQIFGFENSLGKSDPIWIAMYTEKPQTLREMRKMQEHYIALEEIQEGAQDRGVQEASASVEPVPREDQTRSEKRPMAPQQSSGKKEWVEKGKKPRHEPRPYTPLNAPLEEIFKEVEKRNDIRYPKTRGIQFDETRNHPEFCHYHQYRGHSTNNCRELYIQQNEERRSRQRREKNKAKEAKAAEELEKFDIFYEMRTTLKAQAVADFLEDFPLDDEEEVEDIPIME
ncbi:uncharacterized protein LOC113351819 [Papaver somniferum]|uniref:uncharacterized protein LOC113351819 n=1 Tax=Papaver somniferum TaxID=3469 RepID=UPI000E6F841B|nr:uncharacterized protein LOC113351819 [Papaver somniferum]